MYATQQRKVGAPRFPGNAGVACVRAAATWDISPHGKLAPSGTAPTGCLPRHPVLPRATCRDMPSAIVDMVARTRFGVTRRRALPTDAARRIRWLLFACVAWCAPLGAAVPTTAPVVDSPRWQAALGRDHALTGRIWDTARSDFVAETALLDRLVSVPYVVTGESHVNPDHHGLQLRILKAIFGNGRRVTVAMEIFDSDDQVALNDFASQLDPSPQRLVDELGWGRRHRALWESYLPLVRFAGGAGLPLAAMDLTRREAAAVTQYGVDALPAELVQQYGLDTALSTTQQATLTTDLVNGHCGMLFTRNLDGLILAQRARDATMASRMLAADVGGGVMLLAGYGHARGDRGVPYLLDTLRARGDLVSILFASVRDELQRPQDYRQWFGSDRLPFDYVWFTPRADDEDPCDRLKRIYRKAD